MSTAHAPGFILSFGVVGGSIGGLLAAYWLKQAGHSVKVLERNSITVFQTRKFSGLRVPPNASRLLKHIPGMTKILEEKASQYMGSIFLEAESGELVGKKLYGEQMVADLGSKFYRVPYSDLWNHLYSVCVENDVQFMFGLDVQQIEVDESQRPIIISANGEKLSFDLVIGADGHRSALRKVILANSAPEKENDFESDAIEAANYQELSEWRSCRISVPIQFMEADPELSSLATNNMWIVWMGDGIAYTGGREGNEQYSVTIHYTRSSLGKQEIPWDAESRIETEEIAKTVCEPRLKKLLGLSKSCHRSVQEVQNMHEFTDSDRHIILIGDAAHSTLLNGPQNTAIAAEDAFILGYLFSKITDKSQVPMLLKGYNEIKLRRARKARNTAHGHQVQYTLPSGPLRDARNAEYGHSLEGKHDEELARVWRDFIDDNDYDAHAKVAEWWHNWGRLM